MASAQLFYVINLLVYAGVDIIACLGLSQQFGVAGVTNFGFIIFQAAGAYTAAILSLPSQARQRRVPVLPRRLEPAVADPLDRRDDRRAGSSRCRSRSWSGGGCAATSPRSGSWSPRSWRTCW